MRYLPFVSAVLLGAAFLNFHLSYLSFVALVPLFYWFERYYLPTKQPHKRAVLIYWLAGLSYFAICLLWMLWTRPQVWAGISGVVSIIALVYVWLVMTFTFSTSFLLQIYLIKKFRPQLVKNFLLFALIFATSWLVGEYLRAWLLSIVAWGPEASLGPHLNFGTLGYAGAATFVAPLSRLLGLYGTSLLVILVNFVLYWLLRRRWKAASVVAALCIILFLINPLLNPASLKGPVPAGALQVNNSSGAYRGDIDLSIEKVQDQYPQGVQIAVLSEYTDIFSFLEPKKLQNILDDLFKNQPEATAIYTRFIHTQDGKKYDELVFTNSTGQPINTQNKTFLIPTGEYLPVALEIPILLVDRSLVESYKNKRAVNKGTEPAYPVSVNGTSIGALACSGSISPKLYRQLASQGAEVLVNSASLTIFSDIPIYKQQAEQMLRFHSIANQKPFVQAASGGYSYIYNHNGNILASTDEPYTDFIRADVQPQSNTTIYSKYGEWVLVLSTAALLFVLMLLVRQQRSGRPRTQDSKSTTSHSRAKSKH